MIVCLFHKENRKQVLLIFFSFVLLIFDVVAKAEQSLLSWNYPKILSEISFGDASY